MKEITRNLIGVARQRREFWGMKRYPGKGFCNPNRRAVAALLRKERARLGREGVLWFIDYRGKPLVTPPWRQAVGNQP